MKKTALKVLKYVLIAISIYVAILLIEFCCIYAVHGNDTWNQLKDFWNWYSTLFIK